MWGEGFGGHRGMKKNPLDVIQVRCEGGSDKENNSGQIQEILHKNVIQIMCSLSLEQFNAFPSS